METPKNHWVGLRKLVETTDQFSGVLVSLQGGLQWDAFNGLHSMKQSWKLNIIQPLEGSVVSTRGSWSASMVVGWRVTTG